MKSFVQCLAVFLLPVILILAARQARADMWCGDGPGTALSHPCTDDDDYNPAVDDAIAKYRDRWMRIEGVYSVEAGDTYHNRVPSIAVHVDRASVAAARKRIPSSVDGIPVTIVPGEMPQALPAFAYFSSNRAENARRIRKQTAREKAEAAYNLVVRRYGNDWDDMPGVLGIGPRWESDGFDFRTVEVTVQRELLPAARKEIPRSVNGVRIVLTPED